MYKFQVETEKILLGHEEEVFNQLKDSYTNALKDVKGMIKELQANIDILEKADLENETVLRSKIYRLNYQKSLEGQLKATLDLLNEKNTSNIKSFLTKMYEDGYISINYHLQKQGIPVIMPINPSLMIKVINTPVENMKFSERLYDNTSQLKKQVKAEITRGIAQGKSYSEIAKKVSRVTEADFNQAYRIARTEGGRVSSEAKYQSMQAAKEKGADVVKQWDSTLDGRTRPAHAELDQQIRELEEPFEINYEGQKATAMHPHGFGIAALDINCRCVMLSVPRWDIEEENERYDPEHFKETGELVKAKNYEDWKEKYYGVIKEKSKQSEVIKETIEKVSDFIKFGNSDLKTELSQEDKKVLDYYVMDAGAYDINYVLRNNAQPTENDKRAIADLTKAINKAELNDDIEVYRYISNENVFYDLKEGDTYEDKGFMSTTFSESTDRENNYADYKIKAVIKAKKGDNALDVSTIYDEQAYEGEEEREIIFNKNQKMKLVKVEVVRDKYDEFSRKVYYFETI